MPAAVATVVAEVFPHLGANTARELAAAIDPRCAAQCLYMFRGDETLGYAPGGFRRRLYDAMAAADPDNLARLIGAFPAEGLAFSTAQFVPDGIAVLRMAAARE